MNFNIRFIFKLNFGKNEVDTMRMRKKKHTEDRILACESVNITNPEDYIGKWHDMCEGKKLCLEIGCGKGKFACEFAKQKNLRRSEGSECICFTLSSSADTSGAGG